MLQAGSEADTLSKQEARNKRKKPRGENTYLDERCDDNIISQNGNLYDTVKLKCCLHILQIKPCLVGFKQNEKVLEENT